MSEVNLPHDHGQNIEKVLERMPDTDECVVVAEVFKQISDGSRIRILWLLCHCEECVSNIAAAMNMSDPAVSHHLKLLKKSGLITSRREGKEIYYKLADSETAQLLHHIIEEMFRIHPLPRFTISLAKAWVGSRVPWKFSLNTKSTPLVSRSKKVF
jgi:DNA-binding transcriptional ArsR family regulator